MNYDELLIFISKRKKRRLQANYQPLVIKNLVQNNGKLKKQKLLEIIQKSNPELTDEKAKGIEVFTVLENLNILSRNADNLELTLSRINSEQEIELIQHCNDWIENVLIKKEIDCLSKKGVGEKTIKGLIKWWKLRGKIKTRDQMKGIGVDSDEEIEGEIIHGTVRGVYNIEGEEFALSIQSNPDSKYDMEFDREHSTIKLNYIFKDSKNYESDIALLEKSFKNNIPLGLVIVLTTNKWKILGLSKITEHPSKRHFIFELYGISDKESERLKEECFEEYDKFNVSKDLKKISILDWEQFSPQFNPQEERFLKITENPPSLEKKPIHINEIIKNIEAGTWTIPDFQRYYRWKKKDVQEFLESIFNDHYVGGLLLWDLEGVGKDQCGMVPVEGSTPEKLKGDFMVLDGQQRITSLHYAINAPKIIEEIKDSHPGYFYINFGKYFFDPTNEDLETIVALSRQLSDDESFERLLFPFYKLKTIQKDTWLKDLKKFIKKHETINPDTLDDIVEIIRSKTSRIYQTYEIPQINLEKTTFENVGTIFTSINTKGKDLDVFDLINVRMSSFDIKVRTLWDDTLKQYPKIAEYEKEITTRMGRYIMEVISLSFSDLKSCKKNDILDMFGKERKKDPSWTSDKFNQMWNDSTKYLNSAIKLLEQKDDVGFGLIHPKLLPYEPMLPILASLLREIDINFDDDVNCHKKLQRWYWTSIFAERFSESVEAKKSSDYKEMTTWFNSDSAIPKFIEDFKNNFKLIQLENASNKSSVLYTGVLCLLAKKGAMDFEIRFSSNDAIPHMDHIFPKSQIKNHKHKNSILNMTWLTPETNVGTKKAKMPSEYIPKTIKKLYKSEKEFRKVLASHLINDAGYDCLLNDNFDDFIEYRKNEIFKEIANNIDSVYVEESLSEDLIPSSLDTKSIEELIALDEFDELEFKSTMKFNRRSKLPDKIMLEEVITTISGFMNSRKGGILLVGYDEDLDEVNGIDEDYPYVGKRQNWDGWRNMLMSSFSEHCEKDLESFFNPTKSKYLGKTIAKIIVKHSDTPVFYDNAFYVRSHGKTQLLAGSSVNNYINRMWPKLK
jgi:hypothetical protein